MRKVEQDVLEGVVSPADNHFDPYAMLQPKACAMFEISKRLLNPCEVASLYKSMGASPTLLVTEMPLANIVVLMAL